MKKQAIVLALGLLAGTATVHAQGFAYGPYGPGAGPGAWQPQGHYCNPGMMQQRHGQGRMQKDARMTPVDAEQRIEQRLQRMTQRLGLDANQQEQMRSLLKEQQEQRDVQRAERMKQREAMQARMDEILSPEQRMMQRQGGANPAFRGPWQGMSPQQGMPQQGMGRGQGYNNPYAQQPWHPAPYGQQGFGPGPGYGYGRF